MVRLSTHGADLRPCHQQRGRTRRRAWRELLKRYCRRHHPVVKAMIGACCAGSAAKVRCTMVVPCRGLVPVVDLPTADAGEPGRKPSHSFEGLLTVDIAAFQ